VGGAHDYLIPTGCHLRCHSDHALSTNETLMPCVGGELDLIRSSV